MMAEGVWGEKPNPNDFFITVEDWNYDKRFDVSAYLNARDVWLEKVKERLDDLKTDCDGFQKLASDSTLRGAANRKKVEAIKTWLKNAKAQGRISMSDGMKLDEILEAS